MRDLVETVIAEVMRHDPPPQHAARAATQQRNHERFARALDVARGQWSVSAPGAGSPPAEKRAVARPSDRQTPKAPDGRHADWQLWKASRAFEAMMVQQMLDAMRKTVPQSKLLHAGFAEDVQGSMFNQAVARAAAREGGLGIAEAIYRQISRVQDSARNADNDEMAMPVLRARRGG